METLKEKFNNLRGAFDTVLDKNKYIMMMLDGRSFSKVIKRDYELPFDDRFIDQMNQAAVEVMKGVQGAKLAYVQSDEISILLDSRNPESDAFFGGRIEKLLSIVPGIAAGTFNKLAMIRWIELGRDPMKYPPVQFDAKVWTVDTPNDVIACLLYRQNDCVRNSIQQTAQTYIKKRKSLIGQSIEVQKERLIKEAGVDWDSFKEERKRGRIIMKEHETFKRETTTPLGETEVTEYMRSVWIPRPAPSLTEKEEREKLINYIIETGYENNGD